MTPPANAMPFNGTSPRIDPTAWIAPSAVLIGDVDVAADASVFYGAVIRADQDRVVIGAGSNVQDLVAIHVDPGFPVEVGAGVSVGHGAILHGCRIDNDCLIGMGAIILNGAHVGAGSLIAAGALVLAGADIPPQSLVAGSPGKVRRQLSDADLAANRQNAGHYVELSRRHRKTWSGGDS